MSEAKDPAIKLFGKTIPLQEIAAGSGNDSSGAPSSACGGFVEENCNSTDRDPPCTANSSPDSRDGEEREVDKVRIGWIISNSGNDPILYKLKEIMGLSYFRLN